MFSLVNQLRWADIIVVIIIVRCIYIGIKRGFAVEFFKLAGTVLASFACLHYYSVIGGLLSKPEIIPADLGNFIAFIALFALFLFFSYLIREMFLFLIKLQPIEALDKWGGAFLGGIRSIFLSGLILLIFIVSPMGFLEKGAKTSFFGIHTFGTVAKTYSFISERIVKVFFPNEDMNEAIFKAMEE